MSESMVERVARAIFSDDDPEVWDETLRMAAKYPKEMAHYQQDIDETRAKARRAIKAMRVPTEAMVNAADPYGIIMANFEDAWRDMIDEALK